MTYGLSHRAQSSASTASILHHLPHKFQLDRLGLQTPSIPSQCPFPGRFHKYDVVAGAWSSTKHDIGRFRVQCLSNGSGASTGPCAWHGRLSEQLPPDVQTLLHTKLKAARSSTRLSRIPRSHVSQDTGMVLSRVDVGVYFEPNEEPITFFGMDVPDKGYLSLKAMPTSLLRQVQKWSSREPDTLDSWAWTVYSPTSNQFIDVEVDDEVPCLGESLVFRRWDILDKDCPRLDEWLPTKYKECVDLQSARTGPLAISQPSTQACGDEPAIGSGGRSPMKRHREGGDSGNHGGKQARLCKGNLTADFDSCISDWFDGLA